MQCLRGNKYVYGPEQGSWIAGLCTVSDDRKLRGRWRPDALLGGTQMEI